MMSRKQRIYNTLFEAIKPQYCEIVDNSSQHNVPPDAESHFHLTIVSETFCQQSRINRSRHIHRLLSDELSTGLHALSLNLYTLEEWQKRNLQAPSAPPCQHKHP